MNSAQLAIRTRWPMILAVVALSLGLGLPRMTAASDDDWPQYRGADGSGHSADTDLPVKWSADDVLWRIELDGVGQSSPCIWGERIFLTSAKQNEDGVERRVICVDRGRGKILWQKVVSTGEGESIHKMNSWATPTCATDGQRVVAYFGRGGIHCYSMEGEELWSRDLGDFPGPWGTAASPIIRGDAVIQNCDAQGDSYLIALNKKTGKPIWKTQRRSLPRGGWSTPILIDAGQRKELVLNGEFGVQAYNPETGADYWHCQSFNGRGTPIPAWGHGLLYVVNGKPGDVYAVRPGGKGDVTESHMAWHTPRRGGRDLGSPILVDRFLVVVNMQGIGTAYDPADGTEIWKQRIGGNFSSSPVAARGLIYVQDEAGETVVIKPGKTLNILARNSLGDRDGEIFRSSPAPSRGQFFFRSSRALYCVGDAKRVAGR